MARPDFKAGAAEKYFLFTLIACLFCSVCVIAREKALGVKGEGGQTR